MDDLALAEDYAEKIASVDPKSATYGYLRSYWEDSLDKLDETLDIGNNWVKSGDTGIGIVYKFLEKEFDVLDKGGFSSSYQIVADRDELDLVRDRFDKHFSRGYDDIELIGYLRAEYPEVSQRRFRDVDHLPSEQPYKANFGSWNNAHWRAGLPIQDQLDPEELEDQLRRKTHEMNKDTDMLVRTPSAREINEDPRMHMEKQFQDQFGSIEDAFGEAGLGAIRDIERDLKTWHEIVHSPYSKIVPVDPRDIKRVY